MSRPRRSPEEIAQMNAKRETIRKRRVNTRLQEAATDLSGVSAGTHEDSALYDAVETALQNLEEVTAPFYNEPETHFLTDAAIRQISEAYRRLNQACTAYLKDKGPDRSSGYGQARYCLIESIRKYAGEDLEELTAMQKTYPEGERPGLLLTIQGARSMYASLDNPNDIKIEGGEMSQRIPLKVNMNGGEQEVFFTEEVHVRSYQEQMEEARSELIQKYGDDQDCVNMINTVLSLPFDTHRRMKDDGLVQNPQLLSPEMLDSISQSPKLFNTIFSTYMNGIDMESRMLLTSDCNSVKLSESARKCRMAFMEAALKGNDIALNVNTLVLHNKIMPGSRLDSRNVAMSEVAQSLGMGSLICHARNFELDIDGVKKKGSVMDKGDGSDAYRMQKGDPLLDVDESGFETGSLKRDLSDLQVLDFICGNTDRHAGNMLYKTAKVDGKTVVVGVQGIDNDMSFTGKLLGYSNYANEKMVNPADMRIMRKSTADMILSLKPGNLDMILKGHNLTKEELKCCHERLKTLQNQILASRDYYHNHKRGLCKGQILELADDEFEKIPLDKLRLQPKSKEYKEDKNLNYFDRVARVYANKIKVAQERGIYASEDKKIKYAPATSLGGRWKLTDYTERTIRTADLDAMLNAARAGQAKLTAADSTLFSFLHKNSGHYKWMKSSLNELEAGILEMCEKYKKRNQEELSLEDARKLDSLYRRTRKSSEYYLRHSQDPWGTLGQNRRKVAETLKDISQYTRIRQRGGLQNQNIRRTSLNILAEEEGGRNISLEDNSRNSRQSQGSVKSRNSLKSQESMKSQNSRKSSIRNSSVASKEGPGMS